MTIFNLSKDGEFKARETITEKAVHHHYESLSDIQTSAFHPKSDVSNADRLESTLADNQGGRDWFGVDSADAVVSAVEKGWPEGHQYRVQAISGLSMPKPKSVRRKRVRGDMGAELDVHAVNRGNLDRAWETTRKARNALGKPRATIVVNLSGHCGLTIDDMVWQGIAASVLADYFQSCGVPCRIIGAFPVAKPIIGSPKSQLTTVVIKPYSAKLPLDYLLACTALSGIYRTYGFKAICSNAGRVTGFLGSPDIIGNKHNTAFIQSLDDGSTVIPIDHCHSLEAAQTALNTVIDSFKN